MSSPLDPVWQSYVVSRDCLKIARKSIDANEERILNKTIFIGTSKDEVDCWLQRSREEINDYVVMSLWTVFERHLFDCIREHGSFDITENSSEIQPRSSIKLNARWNIGEWMTFLIY